MGRAILNKPKCNDCETKGLVVCATCTGSGLYIDSILECQGIIVKVRCLGKCRECLMKMRREKGRSAFLKKYLMFVFSLVVLQDAVGLEIFYALLVEVGVISEIWQCVMNWQLRFKHGQFYCNFFAVELPCNMISGFVKERNINSAKRCTSQGSFYVI